MDDKLVPLTKEENDAIGRLAYTEDGRLLHRYLRRVLETVVDITEASTLLSQNGRRSLARDLMRHMAAGIEARRGGPSTDDPILTRSSGAVAVASPRGARRRVPESVASPDAEPGADSGNAAS